ncbi:MAG: helix-turn-helix transcriptional regulator [Victivallales bacterium]|jgi:AraC-like DNA-binding protein
MEIFYPQEVKLSRLLRVTKCAVEIWRNQAHTQRGGHTPKAYGIDIVKSGRGEFWTSPNGPRIAFAAGDAILTSMGKWYCYDPKPGSRLEHLWLRADGPWMNTIFDSFSAAGYKPGVFPASAAMIELAEQIFALVQDGSVQSVTKATGLTAAIFTEALSEICRDHSENDDSSGRFSNYVRHQLRASRLDISSFLRGEGMGYETFRKKFKIRTGVSPQRYWETGKLNLSKTLLEHETMSVGEIAGQLGFADVYTFSAFFKRKTGMSPKKFRNESDAPAAPRGT